MQLYSLATSHKHIVACASNNHESRVFRCQVCCATKQCGRQFLTESASSADKASAQAVERTWVMSPCNSLAGAMSAKPSIILSQCACRFSRQNMMVRRPFRVRAHNAHSTEILSPAAPPLSLTTSCRRLAGVAAVASAASLTGLDSDSCMSCCTPADMVAENSSVWRLVGVIFKIC